MNQRRNPNGNQTNNRYDIMIKHRKSIPLRSAIPGKQEEVKMGEK